MNKYKYLIIGGGMTGDAAVKGIREIDADGTICMISSETNPPYSRPPLTKGLWKGSPEEKIWKKTSEHKVDLQLDTKVTSINANENSVATDKGDSYTYENLLLATGGSPVRLPFGADDIIYYRTFDDYKKVRVLANTHDSFAVIGGGFIGSEIAAALAMNGKKVTMIFPSAGIGDRIFPAGLSAYVTEYFRNKGVVIVTGDSVKNMSSVAEGFQLETDKGSKYFAHAVIGGIGIKPNTELAEKAGLEINNGIVVSEELRTTVHNIFAAGDAANFYNPDLEKRMRVEHEDNALKMGKHAGRMMAGGEQPYFHLPFFYSDLFDLGYEAVGELDPSMEIFEDWQEKYKKGVVYYLKDNRVKGVLLWNLWDRVDDARILISEEGVFNSENLKGRIH